MVPSLTNHPLLRDFQRVLNEAHIFLMLNEEHKTVFREKPPIIGWHEARTFKDYLVRAKITNRNTKESKRFDVTVTVARFVHTLRRQMSLKTLMGISMIFVREL